MSFYEGSDFGLHDRRQQQKQMLTLHQQYRNLIAQNLLVYYPLYIFLSWKDLTAISRTRFVTHNPEKPNDIFFTDTIFRLSLFQYSLLKKKSTSFSFINVFSRTIILQLNLFHLSHIQILLYKINFCIYYNHRS